MKTLKLTKPIGIPISRYMPMAITALALLVLWQLVPFMLHFGNQQTGILDNSIWQLLLFAAFAFLGLLLLSAAVYRMLIGLLNLPAVHTMVSQFKTLTSWQQISLYWASFALLLLAAVGYLVAVF